jgi:general stress protein 26
MAITFDRPELLVFMRQHKYVVLSSSGEDGSAQGAMVGVATTATFELVFDTVASSRKHRNLLRDSRVAVTFSGPGEKTLQYEGVASPVSVRDPADSKFRDDYFDVWPDAKERLEWPDLRYWCIHPRWARYSDFDLGPLIVEFRWDVN